jgi:hypothetical protein
MHCAPRRLDRCRSADRPDAGGTLPRMARRQPRLRARVNWAARWGGLACCALIALAFATSCIWAFGLYRVRTGGAIDQVALSLFRGRLSVTRHVVPASPPRHPKSVAAVVGGRTVYYSSRAQWIFIHKPTDSQSPPWRTAATWDFRSGPLPLAPGATQFALSIPAWAPFLVMAVSTALGWKRRPTRRGAAPICSRCRYDLSGLPSGSPCPECAAAPKA